MVKYILIAVFSSLSLLMWSQPQYNPEKTAKEFITSFSKSNLKDIDKLFVSKYDSLGRFDCKCAEARETELISDQKECLQEIAKLHIMFMESGIELKDLQYVNSTIIEKRQNVELLIASSYRGKHIIFKLSAQPTDNGLKIGKEATVLNDEYTLKKYFNIADAECLHLKPQSLFLKPNQDIQCVTSKGADGNGKFICYDYFNSDTLIAKAYTYKKGLTAKLEEYYINGNINYSRNYQFSSKKTFKTVLKIHTEWRSLKNAFKKGNLTHFIHYNENATVDNEKTFYQDSIIIKKGYYNGKTAELTVTDTSQNIISRIKYTPSGSVSFTQKARKTEKLSCLADLETFPSYEEMALQFYSPFYAVRPEAFFHRKPDGWYVEVDLDYLYTSPELLTEETDTAESIQFRFWSYKKQDYEKLPSKVFNQGRQRIKYSFKFEPDYDRNKSFLSGFSGYKGAKQDFINLVLNDPAHSADDIHKLQKPLFLKCAGQLEKDDFVFDDLFQADLLKIKEYTNQILAFEEVTDSTRNSLFYITAELFHKLQIRTNRQTAEKFTQQYAPSKSTSAYLQMMLNQMGDSSIFFDKYVAHIEYFANVLQKNSNYKFVNLSFLKHQWYRDYLEKEYGANIFSLDKKYYDSKNSNLWYVCNNAKDPSLTEYLEQVKKENSTCSDYEKSVRLINSSEKVYNLENCHIYMKPQEFELLDYFANKASFKSIVSAFPYYAIQKDEKQIILYKYCVSKDCGKDDLSELLKPLYGTDFSENEEIRKGLFKQLASFSMESEEIINKKLYIKLIELYSKDFTKDLYQLAVDFAIYAFESGAEELALQMLEKCIVHEYDLCSEYYQDEKAVYRASLHLKKYLRQYKPDLYEQYFGTHFE